ncbi:penicillin-binding transpeptidase domain-containing protein [Kallipyga gabonensis]|uniref:penicillin-binding transpeptidase domain-containing protein n=1 Tax=Kallipyga gabonensis TaxID=1686287 RepID=UPI0006B472FC|nr:penicillin-binding transpeptidase domain-containing protein [Kallipyga gabonensis]
MKKTRNLRSNIIIIFLFILMGALVWKLFHLMILNGEYYRNISASKRTKEIQITAPRGNIYDRNGVLLAGTRISYAVQSYKDEFLNLDKEERDQTLTQLVLYMDEDGVDYLDEFPISSFIFCYKDPEDYFKEATTPQSLAEKTMIQKDLTDEWLKMVYEYEGKEGNYQVSIADRALKAFSLKGHALPLTMEGGKKEKLVFDKKNPKYDTFLEAGKIKNQNDPMALLSDMVKENPTILTQIMGHPAARKMAFDLMKEKKVEGKLTLSPYAYTYKEALLQKKGLFHQRFPGVSADSTARQDFTTMVTASALKDFLTSMAVGEENHFNIPAEALINRLTPLEKNLNLTYRIQSDAKSVSIEYEKTEDTEEKPVDRLIRLAKAHHLLEDLIVDDDFKGLAQDALFGAGLYPGIDIKHWTYGLEKDHADFLKRYKLEDMGPDLAFSTLLEKRKLPSTGDTIWDYGKLVTEGRIIWQADYAYTPVNLCYELSPRAVAKIQENIPDLTGLMVSRESIRFYPNGSLASHVLGYIGKIASEAEVQKYIKEKKYQPNELVGKTGVEEAFEDTLHGVNGIQVVMIDSNGNRTETLSKTEPKAGNNLYLTIDANFQRQSEEIVKNGLLSIKHGISYQSPWGNYSGITGSASLNSGSSISVDPKTGELLSMVSYPDYDPNFFVTGISQSDWKRLNDEENPDENKPKPLLNLTTQSSVQPGSIFKTVVGISSVEHGLNPRATVNCTGYMDIGDQRFRCWIYHQGGSHGPMNLYSALRESCNYYFYVLGLGYDPKGNAAPKFKLEIDELGKTARELGMDQPSGLEINIPREAPSSIPSKEKKVALSKTLLRRFLDANLASYKKEGLKKNPSIIKEDSNRILSWLDEEKPISRNAVIERLDKLGYEPMTPLEGKNEGLADILKYSYFNQIQWTSADSVNTMIGQGQNAYSPVTMLKVDQTIANLGQSYDFTLVREIRGSDNKTMVYKQSPKKKEAKISPQVFKEVQEGMRQASASFYRINNTVPFHLAHKTGTATREQIDPRTGRYFAPYCWIMGFAPFEDPKIATVIFYPVGDSSVNAVPMLRDHAAAYLKTDPSNEAYDSSYYSGYESYQPMKARNIDVQESKPENSEEEDNHAE